MSDSQPDRTLDQALLRAISFDQLKEVAALCRRGANISARVMDERGRESTMLISALKGSSLAVLRQVLELRPQLEDKDSQSVTALYHAVQRNDAQSVALLLEAGASMHTACRAPNDTPLYRAAAANCLDALKVILASDSIDYKVFQGIMDVADKQHNEVSDFLNGLDSGVIAYPTPESIAEELGVKLDLSKRQNALAHSPFTTIDLNSPLLKGCIEPPRFNAIRFNMN